MKFNKKYLSPFWIASGALAGIGYIIAIFYILIKEKGNERWLGIMFFIGPIGALLVYLLTRKSNVRLVRISLGLLIGFAIWVIIALPLGINPLYQLFGYVHGWLSD
ncbi:hypothetical protein SJAV_25460 [Sulfurisphaera javensis]|uniref:Uncharacterized protein n=1 Tax=Sulfurisphaera javensis TaxID=2049879 RepID=A0AAT9GUG5_9CREN